MVVRPGRHRRLQGWAALCMVLAHGAEARRSSLGPLPAFASKARKPNRPPPPPPPPRPRRITPQPLPRIDARDALASPADFAAAVLEAPAIVTGAFDPAGGGGRRFPDDEGFSDCIFSNFASVEVEYQIKGNGPKAKPQLYRAPLEDVVEGIMAESSHAESWYLLTEDLLDEAKDDGLRSPLVLPPALFGRKDLFDLFPPSLRPKRHCLIMGGAGARSFLHVDPYEWTGLNYLFEGEKLWTFVRPSAANEAALGLGRVLPDAWSDSVCAGWKSDAVDLYRSEPAVSPQGEVTLGLPPSLALEDEASDVWAGTQGEGELVVIPPRWAHQVYHLAPSLALAWQVCNRPNLRRVLSHMLVWSAERGGKDCAAAQRALEEVWGPASAAPPGEDDEGEFEAWAKGRIEATLERAMALRHGEEEGRREFQRLMREGGRG